MEKDMRIYGKGGVWAGVKECLIDCLGEPIRDVVAPSSSLRKDLDADDLDMIELVMALEEKFGIELEERTEKSWHSVHDIIDTIVRLLGGRHSEKLEVRAEETVMGEVKIETLRRMTEHALQSGSCKVHATVWGNGRVTVTTKNGVKEFIFHGSKPEVLEEIGKLLIMAGKLGRRGGNQ